MSQSQVLDRFVTTRWSEVVDISRWVSGQDFSHVVVAARGSSDNAARYAQYLWGSHNQLNVALAAPSLYTLFDSPPNLAGSLMVGISQSGESPDLLAVLENASEQGRPTLAITNKPGSPMARLADRHLDLGAGPETAIAATKSYTSQLLAVASLSAALAGRESDRESLFGLADVVAQTLAREEDIASTVGALVDQTRCVVVGRGFNHATASEWALKISELSYLVAQPFSAADFRHGPMALVEPGLVILCVATDGPLWPDMVDLIQEVGKGGATTIAITDRPDCPADDVYVLPGQTPEWLSPIPITVAAQLFTYHLTLARGLDPDNPRAIQKVTKTT